MNKILPFRQLSKVEWRLIRVRVTDWSEWPFINLLRQRDIPEIRRISHDHAERTTTGRDSVFGHFFQKNVKTTALADHRSTVIRRVGFHVMSNAMY